MKRMDRPIATIKRTKEIQEKYNVFTKKSYGQNFIIEPRVVEKIADAAIKSKDELVFEIGPGIGALTQYQFAYILEFNSDSDLDNALEEIVEGIDSAAVRGLVEGLVEDAQNSDYINGNCFLLPSLINNSEKVELFIKNKP